jgi:glycosyltransferase involved in cell wall biosynthesis
VQILFHPPGENELTGGYLYNNRIAEALAEARVERVVPSDLGRALASAAGPNSQLIVDSLYIHDDTDLAAIERHGALALLHHLPSLDPGFPEAARASQRQREDALLRAASALIATSEFMRELLVSRGVAKPIAVCPPGVDAVFFATEPQAAAAPPELITVANLEPRKGYLEQIDPLASVAADAPFHWHIVGDLRGDEAYAARVAARLEAAGLAERVTLHGKLDRAALVNLLGPATVHLLPTRFETYGMVVAESLAAGIPIIAPRLGEIARLVRDGEDGLLAKPGDPDALAAAVARVLREPDLAAALRQGARSRRETLPTWADAARTFRDHVRMALAEACCAGSGIGLYGAPTKTR